MPTHARLIRSFKTGAGVGPDAGVLSFISGSRRHVTYGGTSIPES